ncbi:MAG: hypothetical protein NTX05_00280 [Fusobacteria bacterium]|nr:hypothetical protein [Fusobacteriota bacterium]
MKYWVIVAVFAVIMGSSLGKIIELNYKTVTLTQDNWNLPGGDAYCINFTDLNGNGFAIDAMNLNYVFDGKKIAIIDTKKMNVTLHE